MTSSQEFLDTCDFDKGNGTIPVIVQDAVTKDVLMMAYADQAAVALTIETGEMHFLSRERGPWKKGETSGNTQNLVSLNLDCDQDTILALVHPQGPACHTGSITCFINNASYTNGES